MTEPTASAPDPRPDVPPRISGDVAAGTRPTPATARAEPEPTAPADPEPTARPELEPTGRPEPTGDSGVRRRGALLALFLALCVAGGTWALASPLFSVPDEASHVVYAAGAVRGELGRGNAVTGGTFIEVPATYYLENNPRCYFGKPYINAACDPALVPKAGERREPTSAGLYPPPYYLVVGLPTLIGTNSNLTVYGMRLITVLMSAGLLTWAFALAANRRRTARWRWFAVLAAVTPMTLYFAGSVNPQAIEIAAAVVCWVAAMRAFETPPAVADPDAPQPVVGRDPSLLPLAFAGAVLAVARPLSPVWLAAILVVTAVAALTPARFLALLRRPSTWVSVLIVVIGVGFSAVWTLLVQQLQSVSAESTDRQVLQSVQKLGIEVYQMIGTFGSLDTPPPALVFFVWLAALGALAVVTLIVGPRRLITALVLLLVLCCALPVLLETSAGGVQGAAGGLAWQGRYTLPLAVGVPLLAGYARVDRLPAAALRRGAGWGIAALTVAYVFAFYGTLSRYVVGEPGVMGFGIAHWHPPLPWQVLVVLFLVGTVGVAVAASNGIRRPVIDAAGSAAPGPRRSDGRSGPAGSVASSGPAGADRDAAAHAAHDL